MKIHIPNSAFLGNIDPFIRSFDPSDPESLSITLNPHWTSVHPVVLSMIAAVGLNVDPKKITIDKLEAKSSAYLVRMGLLRMLNISCDTIVQERAAEGRFIPLRQVRTSDELVEFITEMIPLLHTDPEHAKTISYIVSELGRNVLEHAMSPNGAILCAQYYKKSNTIRLGIADTGYGIKKTITQSHVAKTDLDAIRLALWPGITGTTQNAGAGLFFVKAIASLNKDFFVLYSGNGFYKLLIKKSKKIKLYADPFNDRHSKVDKLPYWQGTLVGVDISLNQTREYSELLNAIREMYFALRKTNKTHKKPRFL